MGGADTPHVLPHRADVIVLVGVVMEVVVMKRVGFVARALFDVETVVFDVSLHAGLVHEAVVFFRAIAGVGDCDRGQMSVAVEEGVEERYQRQSVGGIGEQGEVGDELVFGRDLKVVSGLGLAVVHGVLLHAHECGIRVGLRHRVAPADLLKAAVILFELVAMLLQILYLFLFLAQLLLLFLVRGFRLCRKCVFEFADKRVQCVGSKPRRFSFRGLVLRYDLVNLSEQSPYFLLKFRTVLLNVWGVKRSVRSG